VLREFALVVAADVVFHHFAAGFSPEFSVAELHHKVI